MCYIESDEATVCMAKTKSINLLPQEEFEASTLGRILRWATGSFRIIVIATEMVVMAAFLSRFWLDAQNSDLNDSLQIKSAQITAQKDFETEFRQTQAKLDIYKKINSSNRLSSNLDLVTSKVPNEVTLSTISLGPDSIDLKGASVTESGIAQFIGNLKAEPTFKNVGLGAVNSSESDAALTEFSIKISLK